MATHPMSLEGAAKLAVHLVCSGSPNGALEVLRSLGLNEVQNNRITAFFQEIELKDANASVLEKHIVSVLSEDAPAQFLERTVAAKGLGTRPIDVSDEPAAKKKRTGLNDAPKPIRFPLLELPQELLCRILAAVSITDIFMCQRVCKQLNYAVRDELLCKEIYDRDIKAYDPKKDRSSDFYNAFINIFVSRMNVLRGVYSGRILCGHTDKVNALAVVGRNLCSSSFKEIKVWNPDTGESLKTFESLGEKIFCLAHYKGQLCSGSSDAKVRVWNLGTGECTQTLQGPGSGITALIADEEKEVLFAGYGNGMIQAWNLETQKCLSTFQAHSGLVRAFAIFQGMLYSGSDDKTIAVWDLKDEKQIRVIEGHTGAICSLLFLGNSFYSSSIDGKIKTFHPKTGEFLMDLEKGCRGSQTALVPFDGWLCSSDATGAINIWRQRQFFTAFNGHSNIITSLVRLDRMLCTGSYDKTVKVWDFTASHRVVFKEIATLFRGEEQNDILRAMGRFLGMPGRAQAKVYIELYRILVPFSNDNMEYGRDAFRGENGLSATPEQKAQAIENYLKSEG